MEREEMIEKATASKKDIGYVGILTKPKISKLMADFALSQQREVKSTPPDWDELEEKYKSQFPEGGYSLAYSTFHEVFTFLKQQSIGVKEMTPKEIEDWLKIEFPITFHLGNNTRNKGLEICKAFQSHLLGKEGNK